MNFLLFLGPIIGVAVSIFAVVVIISALLPDLKKILTNRIIAAD